MSRFYSGLKVYPGISVPIFGLSGLVAELQIFSETLNPKP